MKKRKPSEDRRKFEAEHPNDMWQRIFWKISISFIDKQFNHYGLKVALSAISRLKAVCYD